MGRVEHGRTVRPVHFLVPGPLTRLTGGTIYDRRIIEGLRLAGRPVVAHELPGTFPDGDATARAAVAAAVAEAPDGAALVVDGLAAPALAACPEAADGRRLIVLCHHPVARETGLAATERARLRGQEAAVFSRAARVVVTSGRTANQLADYDVPPDRIGVVRPGLDPPAGGFVSPRRAAGRPARLLCVGNLIPRKGHQVLVAALAQLTDLDWRLSCIGSLEDDPATVRRVRAAIEAHGLAGRVELVGGRPAAELDEPYRRADLFVLPSRYEGFGMAFSEAMSYALPAIAAAAGAVPETVPRTAGILVPPDDAAAFAEAVRRVLEDDALYRRMSAGAVAAAREFGDWAATADRFASEIDKA